MKNNKILLSIMIIFIFSVFINAEDLSERLLLNINRVEIPSPSLKVNQKNLGNLLSLSDPLEKEILISKLYTSKDVKNIISELKLNLKDISTNSIGTYRYFIDENRNFPVAILALKNGISIFYVPQTKFQDGVYIRSFAKIINTDIKRKDLISEYGKLLDPNIRMDSPEDGYHCGPCETLPNGFHQGEEMSDVLDTDWGCVGQKQGLCGATCAVMCVPPTTPTCAKCITSCESAAIYTCTKTVKKCVNCDDAPLPGDFRNIKK